MPIYEYVCKACGHQFEKLTTLASAHVTQECPKCGALKGERALSKPNLRGAAYGGGGGCGHTSFG